MVKLQGNGRYDLRGADYPPNGVGPPQRGVDAGLVAVADPLDRGRRIVATVNRHTDLLEEELSRGRISVAAYAIGRSLQRLFERAAVSGAPSAAGGGRIDQGDHALQQERRVLRGIADAREVQAAMRGAEQCVGRYDARLLRMVLDASLSWEGICRTLRLAGGDRDQRYVARRFREALEAFAEGQAAVGRKRA